MGTVIDRSQFGPSFRSGSFERRLIENPIPYIFGIYTLQTCAHDILFIFVLIIILIINVFRLGKTVLFGRGTYASGRYANRFTTSYPPLEA